MKKSPIKLYLTGITILLLVLSIVSIFFIKPANLILWGVVPFGIASIIVFVLNLMKAIKQKSLANEIFFKLSSMTIVITTLALPSTLLPVLGLDMLSRIPESRYVILLFAVLSSLNIIYAMVKE